YPCRAWNSLWQPLAALLAAALRRQRADSRAAQEARQAAGRGAGRVPPTGWQLRLRGRALRASRRLTVLRLRRGRRDPLSLSRLEVRRLRQVPGAAVRAGR